MSDRLLLPRRRFLRIAATGIGASAGAGLLAGCNALSNQQGFVDVLSTAEPINRRVQRFMSGDRLVREYPTSMISPSFRPNGSTNPKTPEYLALQADGFSGYRLHSPATIAWKAGARSASGPARPWRICSTLRA